MIKKLFIALFASAMISCAHVLDEYQRDIVENGIPIHFTTASMYEQYADMAQMIIDAVMEISDEESDKINDNLSDYFGEIYYTFGNYSKDVNKYKSTIDYIGYTMEDVNKSFEAYIHLLENDRLSVIESQRLVNAVELQNSEDRVLSLNVLHQIPFFPDSVSCNRLTEKMLRAETMIEPGSYGADRKLFEFLFGSFSQCSFDSESYLALVLTMFRLSPSPKPVYAYFDSYSECWEIGYDSGVAVMVAFTGEGQGVSAKWEETEYDLSLMQYEY